MDLQQAQLGLELRVTETKGKSESVKRWTNHCGIGLFMGFVDNKKHRIISVSLFELVLCR